MLIHGAGALNSIEQKCPLILCPSTPTPLPPYRTTTLPKQIMQTLMGGRDGKGQTFSLLASVSLAEQRRSHTYTPSPPYLPLCRCEAPGSRERVHGGSGGGEILLVPSLPNTLGACVFVFFFVVFLLFFLSSLQNARRVGPHGL